MHLHHPVYMWYSSLCTCDLYMWYTYCLCMLCTCDTSRYLCILYCVHVTHHCTCDIHTCVHVIYTPPQAHKDHMYTGMNITECRYTMNITQMWYSSLCTCDLRVECKYTMTICTSHVSVRVHITYKYIHIITYKYISIHTMWSSCIVQIYNDDLYITCQCTCTHHT